MTTQSTRIGGASWSGAWAEAYLDYYPNYRHNISDVDLNGVDYHNRINYSQIGSLTRNQLIRLTMHEIGHALGLDHESIYSLMNTNNLDPYITDSMWTNLGYLGYSFDKNAVIYWS